MNDFDQFTEPKEGTHKTAHFLEALGVVLLVALAGWLIFSAVFPREKQDTENPTNGAVAGHVTPEQKQEMIDQMSIKVSDAPIISVDEKEKMIEEMSQKVPSAGAVTPTGTVAPTASTPTAAERQKMLEAMQQKIP